MTDPGQWIVFVHIVAAFVFAAGHGVSMITAFSIRRERDRVRLAALLDASAASLNVAGIGLVALLASGVIAGWMRGSFGQWWIWISLALFLVIGGLMTPVGGIYYARLRQAIGQRPRNLKPDQPDPVPVSDEELDALLRTRRPELLLLMGGVGFVVILFLMRFRPF